MYFLIRNIAFLKMGYYYYQQSNQLGYCLVAAKQLRHIQKYSI